MYNSFKFIYDLCVAVVVVTGQFHFKKSDFRKSAGSNPARSVSGVCCGHSLRHSSQLGIRFNALFPFNHFTKNSSRLTQNDPWGQNTSKRCISKFFWVFSYGYCFFLIAAIYIFDLHFLLNLFAFVISIRHIIFKRNGELSAETNTFLIYVWLSLFWSWPLL